MGSYLIAWSGGADSTALLRQYAAFCSVNFPARAITIARHPNLGSQPLRAQGMAQARFLRWAKARGLHIRHERMAVTGCFHFGDIPKAWGNPTGQPTIGLAALMQAVGDGDEVLMGYVKQDCFWHYRPMFEAAFEAACRLKGVHATLAFPLEWKEKVDVLASLRAARVPDACWFSCENTKTGRPCGTCSKCREIRAAREESKRRAEVKG